MSREKANKLKGDGRYVDAPRFKAIYGYEDDFKNCFDQTVSSMVKEIVVTTKSMLDEKE